MNALSRIAALIKPFWPQALMNVFFNLISTVFSLVSLAMIIPFLQILFQDGPVPEIEWPGWDFTNMQALFEYGLYWLMDTFDSKIEALLSICLFVIAIFFVKNLARYLAMFFMADLRTGVTRDMRSDIYSKIQRLPLSYYSEQRKGDIITRATTDVAELEWSVLSFLEMIFKEPFTFIVYLGAMFLVSPWLTLMVLGILPVAGFIIASISRSLRKNSQLAQTQLGGLMSIMEETISGLRAIWAFGASDSRKAKFEEENKTYYKLNNRILKRRDMASPVSEFLGIAVVVLVLYLGGKVVLGKQGLQPEVFIYFLVVFSQIIQPAKALSTAWYNIQKGLASLDRVDELLNETEGHPAPLHPVSLDGFNKQIEFKNVSFAYEDRYVLQDFNLTIRKGELVALVGQSGSGKSTIIELLQRNYEIEEGSISIDGVDIRNIPIENLRSLFGLVTQEPILFNDTVANNVRLGNKAPKAELEKALKMANAESFVKKLDKGLETRVGDRGTKLSGGEKQRITIARAILRNPPVMLLDEATSALDSESEKAVQAALDQLMANKTSLVIAHRLSTIQNADRIVVMKDGRIIETGNHQSLMASDSEYKQLVEWQML